MTKNEVRCDCQTIEGHLIRRIAHATSTREPWNADTNTFETFKKG